MSKKVYLAGPMSGRPYFNFPTFFDYEVELANRGFTVWSPARNDVAKFGDFYLHCPNGSQEELHSLGRYPTYRTALKDDLNYILDHADAIALIPGWEQSKGARCEHALAVCLGLDIIFLEPLQ